MQIKTQVTQAHDARSCLSPRLLAARGSRLAARGSQFVFEAFPLCEVYMN